MVVPDRVVKAVQRVSGQPWFAKVAPKIVPPVDKAVSKLTGGRVLLSGLATPAIVLTCVGAKSGVERDVPLAFMRDDAGWVVVASNFGREKHPGWMYNLKAHPDAWVTERGTKTAVTARVLTDAERDAMWARIVANWPTFATYDARTPDRELQVFLLEPRTA